MKTNLQINVARNIKILLWAAACLCGLIAPAQAQLEWRVSVKFILDADGNLPSNPSKFGAVGISLTNRQAVTTLVNHANTLLETQGRGYRFRVTEVINLGEISQWFNVEARSEENRNALESAALADPARYAWRENAINLYINNTFSGVCSLPDHHSIIFIGSDSYKTIFIHEAGHFFGLMHTHQGELSLNSDGSHCKNDFPCTCATFVGGNADGVADTITDHQCWSKSEIIANNPNASTTDVDNVYLNLMSYHLPQDRFTPDQLDRMTDISNSQRANVATGRTLFVDRNNHCGSPNGGSYCGFLLGGPFHWPSDGVRAASPGDIVLIRAGSYPESFTINGRVTLRASRGRVVIGR